MATNGMSILPINGYLSSLLSLWPYIGQSIRKMSPVFLRTPFSTEFILVIALLVKYFEYIYIYIKIPIYVCSTMNLEQFRTYK